MYRILKFLIFSAFVVRSNLFIRLNYSGNDNARVAPAGKQFLRISIVWLKLYELILYPEVSQKSYGGSHRNSRIYGYKKKESNCLKSNNISI